MGQDLTTILTGIGTIVLMLAVFVGAYYFSKFVSKKYPHLYVLFLYNPKKLKSFAPYAFAHNRCKFLFFLYLICLL